MDTPTPGQVARIYAERVNMQAMRTRRANCHRAGYHGPLTRDELAARIAG